VVVSSAWVAGNTRSWTSHSVCRIYIIIEESDALPLVTVNMVTGVPKATPNSQNLSHDASCFVPSKSALPTEETDENAFKTPVVVRGESINPPVSCHVETISFGDCCPGIPSAAPHRLTLSPSHSLTVTFAATCMSCTQSRKTSAAAPSGANRTPDLGQLTRSVIQSLENIKFTPSQGVCTPSPTILVHHHHHVYGATTQGPVQDDQINSAYLAGLAAGRADAELKLTAGHPLIPAAMYEPSRVHMNGGAAGVVHGGRGGRCGRGGGGAGRRGWRL
jgi:hypothetical protein